MYYSAHYTVGRSSYGNQRGVATILIMLMVGLSLIAAVLGVTYHIRGTQDKLLAVQSETQAQLRVWSGVEAVRQYLDSLRASNQLATLAAQIASNGTAPTALSITGLSNVSAQFTAVDSATSPTQFTADITGTAAQGTRGEGNSIVRVVFALQSGSVPPLNPPNPNVLNFNRNLKLSGGITVETDASAGSAFTVSVNGDLMTSGNSITGVSVLNVMGTASLDSGSSFDVINANCDVRLTGSVKSKVINARRHVCMDGGTAGTTAINANGKVSITSAYNTNGDITAIGNPVDVGSCRPTGSSADHANKLAQTCDTPASDYVVDLFYYGSAYANSVKAKGNVRLGYGHIGNLQAEGKLTSNWNSTVDGGAITGKVEAAGGTVNKTQIKVTENSTGLSVSIPLVSRVTLTSKILDANDYKPIANYIFFVDAQGYKKVTVNNVNGIANGTYYIGNFAPNELDYVCAELAPGASIGSPNCAPSGRPIAKKICNGQSLWNACFGYDSSNKTWTINANTSNPPVDALAPGIALFDGSLNLNGGIYYNTLIATQNISTSSSVKVYAPNFAGYSGSVDGQQYAPDGICANTVFPNLYPKQFCDIDNQKFIADAAGGTGNFTLIAGSVKNGKYTGPDSYVGGNIATGALSELFGNMEAGNEFTSSGDTTIHGYVTALGAGMTTYNALSGATKFILKKLPSSFKLGGTTPSPCVAQCNPSSTSPGVGVKWVRYL